MELLAGRYRRDMLQVFVLTSGFWFPVNISVAHLPIVLATGDTPVSSKGIAMALLVAGVFNAAAAPRYGMLSQRIGRRNFSIWYGVAAAVITPALCFLAIGGRDRSGNP
ncbi:MFS transporter [Streptomyces paludis]|uniref:MFS transporter n=1 Tax=Streptomyces paludis TaxID=2282738 RepID=A0A345HYG9_9ACTN|nr:hypothetical protein [Streptomyces paludis]AXG81743.1 hypothetical protein DVK44_32990 [Streptomyces paludis]